jgi:hypothetical protein
MVSFDKVSARDKLASFSLTAANRHFAEYWLSMLDAAGRPCVSTMPREGVRAALRFTLVQSVKPGHSVTMRNIGPGAAALLPADLTSADMIAMLPALERPIRLERVSDVAMGYAARNHRRIVTTCGREFLAEELLLPFGDFSPHGERQVLVHVDVTPLANASVKVIPRVMRPAEKVECIELDFDDRVVWV